MSELEARKYTSIRNLREEIRRDMEDYKLLWTGRNVGHDDYRKCYLFLPQDTLYAVNKNSIYYKFSEYLQERIIDNLIKLVEQNNE
jgi:hypothetical protein